jgi:hypothetical protein
MIKLKDILLEVHNSNTPVEDLPKKKMGEMWFKRWMTPKKEEEGWEWEEVGGFYYITRPGYPKPTARYEKETGLLQGHWLDDMEYQW